MNERMMMTMKKVLTKSLKHNLLLYQNNVKPLRSLHDLIVNLHREPNVMILLNELMNSFERTWISSNEKIDTKKQFVI